MMKKYISLFLVIALCLTLCACGGGNSKDKEKLCNGVWYSQTKNRVGQPGDFLSFDQYSTNVYDFSSNGRFVHTYIVDGGMGDSDPLVREGNYKIDESDKQIILTYDNGDSKTIPYAINEYTHAFVFYVDNNGNSAYSNTSSMNNINTYPG